MHWMEIISSMFSSSVSEYIMYEQDTTYDIISVYKALKISAKTSSNDYLVALI